MNDQDLPAELEASFFWDRRGRGSLLLFVGVSWRHWVEKRDGGG